MTYPYITRQERELRRKYESLRVKRKFQIKRAILNATFFLGLLSAAAALVVMVYYFVYIIMAQ